jgi:hypothetical protein
VDSGELVRPVTRNDSCPQAFVTGFLNQTITWNTGQTTTMRIFRSATLIDGIFTVHFSGVVTSGLFAGSAVEQEYVANGHDLQHCLEGKGTVVKSIISKVTLTISH